MNKTFTIPLSERCAKYLERKFEDVDRPWQVEEDSLLGKLVMSLLNDKREFLSFEEEVQDYEYSVQINLSDALAKRSPNSLKLSHLNKMVDLLFRNNLEMFVIAQISLGFSRSAATANYLAYLGLDDRHYNTCYQYVTRKANRPYEKAYKKGIQGRSEANKNFSISSQVS